MIAEVSLISAATVILWGALAIIVYTYIGYPLALLAVKRIHAPVIAKAELEPMVSIVIAAHNEEQRIADRIRNCLELDYPKDRLEVVVASDGSDDATDSIVAGFEAEGVRLLSLPGPRGKATALSQAVPECSGEILVMADARQTFSADAVTQLVANFADAKVGVVSGELHISSPGRMEGVGLYWKYEKLIRQLESDIDSTVGVTGAIYAIRKELFQPLDPRTLLDDVVIPMRAALAGYRVIFDPTARAYDELQDSASHEFRRRVRTLAGNYQLLQLMPGLLNPLKNRLIWQLVSHKLLRLVVPWCLVSVLLISLGLSLATGQLLYQILFAAQICAFALAAMGALKLRSRLASACFSFFLLNAAAVVGLVWLLLGRQSAAWKAQPGAQGESN